MTPRKALGLIAFVAVLLYVAFLCGLYFSQTTMIYPGTRNQVDPSAPGSQGVEVLRIPTSAADLKLSFFCQTTARRPRRNRW
jgi:hypothetical protein